MAERQGRMNRGRKIISSPSRIFDGHMFTYAGPARNNIRRLKCYLKKKERCPAQGTLNEDNNEFTYDRNRNLHSHDRDQNLLVDCQFLRDLYMACRLTFRSNRAIYNEEAELNPEAAQHLSFHNVQARMKEWRKPKPSPVVESSAVFKERVEALAGVSFKFHDHGRFDVKFVDKSNGDGHCAIFFGDHEYINGFINMTNITIESTTKFAIPEVQSLMLTTVTTKYEGYNFPILWIAVIDNSEDNYAAFINDGLQHFLPNVPESVSTDFDHNLNTHLNDGNVTKEGTFYSHCKILLDCARENNVDIINNVDNRLVINYLMSLSLLPAERILDGFLWLYNALDDQLFEVHNEILRVYFNKWIKAIGAENFSFFRKNHLLTDVSKQAWLKLSNEMGENQDIWSFLEAIVKIQGQCCRDFLKLPRDPRKRNITCTDKVCNVINSSWNAKELETCWNLLENERLEIPNFLMCCTGILQNFLNNLIHRNDGIIANFNLIKKIPDNEQMELNFENLPREAMNIIIFEEIDYNAVRDYLHQIRVIREPQQDGIPDDGLVVIGNEMIEQNEPGGNDNVQEIRILEFCLYCHDANPDVLTVPCNHVGLCEPCSVALRRNNRLNNCLYCQQEILETRLLAFAHQPEPIEE